MSKYLVFSASFSLLLVITSCTTAKTAQPISVLPSSTVETRTYPTFTPSPSRPSLELTITRTAINNPCHGFDVYSVSTQENTRFQDGLLTEIGTQDVCNINGNNIAFSPDGNLLALANYDGTRVYKVQTGQLIHYFAIQESELNIAHMDIINSKGDYSITTIEGGVIDAIFSPNGQLLAAITQSGEVKLWNLRTGTAVNTFSHQSNEPSGSWAAQLTFDKTGSRLIAFTNEDNLIRIWNVVTGELITSIVFNNINSATISPDGQYFAIGGHGWEIYDIHSQQIVHSSLSLKQEFVGYLAFGADGQSLYTTNWLTGEVFAWDISTGEKLLSFNNCVLSCKAEGPMNAYGKFGLTSDNSRLVFDDFNFSSTGYVNLWNTQTGILLDSLEADRLINALAISSDGTKVAALSRPIDEQYMKIYFWSISSK